MATLVLVLDCALPSTPNNERLASGCHPHPPKGMVDLMHAVPGLRLDVRYARSDNFTGAPLPGYEVEAAWMAEAPARALAKVQHDLREQGLGLVVFDAYRPRRATKAMVEWAEANGRLDLLDDGYVARTSGHARGHTVDLGLVDLGSGEVLDMGTDFDTFSAASHTRRAEGEVLERRMLLRDAMRRRGFKPYAREWWHFAHPTEGLPSRDVAYACED